MEKSALTVSKKNFDGIGHEVLLLLPACAEGFLELDEAFVFVTAGRCERQFSRIERPLSIQKFKVGRSSSRVTKRRDANRFLQIRHGVMLAHSHLMELLVTYQSIGNVSERASDC